MDKGKTNQNMLTELDQEMALDCAEGGAEKAPIRPPHILVVDDDNGVRNLYRKIIEGVGYRCTSVPSARMALEVLNQEDVDVVITDIRMPGLNGFSLIDLVKKKCDADIIAITGYGAEYSYEEAVEKGASDFALKPVGSKELVARLKRVLRERSLISEQRQMEERLRALTITDHLTALYNSRYFFQQLQSEITRAVRYEHPLSLLLIDMDNFKQYNDRHGHLEGDKVLARMGEIIQECVRKIDSSCRYGGDEFTVILPETGGSEATEVAERIRKSVLNDKFSFEQGESIKLTVSIGIAEHRADEGLTEFAKRADEAMFMAKRRGGNQLYWG